MTQEEFEVFENLRRQVWGWYRESERLKAELAQSRADEEAAKKEAIILRRNDEHESQELFVADQEIRSLRECNKTLYSQLGEQADEIERLEKKVRGLQPAKKRGTVQYGKVEPLTVARASFTYEDIMQSVESTAMSLEAESSEQLSRIYALFDGEDEEFLEEMGRGGVKEGYRLHRPGSWTLAGLAMRDK